MKKEMKRALVALGLSTLLVPTFASQVVYAQENDTNSRNESFYKTNLDVEKAARDHSEEIKSKSCFQQLSSSQSIKTSCNPDRLHKSEN